MSRPTLSAALARTTSAGLLFLVTVPLSAADRPPECVDIAPSAGAVPMELQVRCGDLIPGDPSRLPEGIPDALGPENVGATFSSMESLGTPSVLTALGPLSRPDGDFIGGCEFDGSDLSELFCYDAAAAGGSSSLFTVDTADATVTEIGDGTLTGLETVGGLASDPTDGTMYAVGCDIDVGGNCTSSLYSADLSTGALERIGPTGPHCMIGIGITNSGALFGYDICTDALLSIDKTTGAGSTIGPLGFDANFGQGMDFDPSDGTCYLFAFNNVTFQSELRTCDTNDGSTTLVGAIGDISPGGLTQMAGVGITKAAPLGPQVTVSPDVCPGAVQIDISGGTPGGRAAIVSSAGLGQAAVPAGPCVGTPTGLAAPLALRRLITLDGGGGANLNVNLPAGACGGFVQVLDVTTCTVGNTEGL